MILVDAADRIIGSTTKQLAHTVSDTGLPPLHRAFSVFLFRGGAEEREIMLQRRSAKKANFPMLWSNACCSHPCFDIPDEHEFSGTFGIKEGVMRAASRRLNFELNMDVHADRLKHHGTKTYSAVQVDGAEHEGTVI